MSAPPISAWRRLALAAGLVLLTTAAAAAQGASELQTRRVLSNLRSADALRRAGQTLEARSLLEGVLRSCLPGASGSACRQTVSFNLGYLLQDAPDTSEARSALHDAVRYYRAALAEAPGHRATLLNLALIYTQLDPAEADPAVLVQAATVDSARAGVYLASASGMYLARGDTTGAVRALQRAMQLAPDDPTAPARAVTLYTAQGVTGARALAELLPSWEIRFPELAGAGYLAVMAAAREADTTAAQNALVRWVRLRAGRGQISTAALAELPAGWRPTAVTDLARYLADPWQGPQGSWWLRHGELASEALAASALALGQDMLGAQKPEPAERCWRTAAVALPVYLVGRLALIRALASLYFRVPSLDPTGAKLESLDRELFEEKGMAIARGDLEQIQEYHATLGLLYAERGVWRSPAPWRNGLFQLDQALVAAAQRERETGFHQPLPELRIALARGYASALPARAGPAYLDAAKAYLDTDDLGRAALALDSAARYGAPVVVVRRVLELRTAAARPAGAPCDTIAIHRATDGLPRSSDSDFLARQQFKTLSDCAAAAPVETRAAIAAAALAVPAERRMTLVGAADLLRLDTVKQALLSRVHVQEGDSRVTAQAPASAARVIPLILSADARPTYVSLSAATSVALQVARTLPASVDVRLRDNTVVVTSRLRPDQEALLRRRLTAVRGIRGVVVQPDSSRVTPRELLPRRR